ncbi:uncharacterized protein BO80DRAFT_425703 [Aspergillus ibericus CBS 121593]|uniref:Uncharacterized protein n=1 Tax=Aspergillus ibericus CBS 121593 TaxID=1448316 RepID=A0A395GYZ2_9EURO|nr:hypothetical protein BO80DRAFT_425703 [Aspergillus ibericus CBS 121593]RAL00543.1 hypothetical protein BO80DRAFT_425703 [Aspergillus ibericus CBS 121593]
MRPTVIIPVRAVAIRTAATQGIANPSGAACDPRLSYLGYQSGIPYGVGWCIR